MILALEQLITPFPQITERFETKQINIEKLI